MPNRSERTFVAASKGIMAVSTLLVGFFAAIVCSTDAAISAWAETGTGATEFGSGAYKFEVPEGTLDSTIEVKATTDPQADVTYTLVETTPADGPFEIAVAKSGVITLTAALDFETTATHTLKITAVDGTETNNQVTATAEVTINVQDVFTFSTETDSACVPDGAIAGDEVTTLPIADKFNDKAVSYSMTGTGYDNFAVDAAGKVTLANTITKGDGDPYTLVIKQGQAAGTLTLTVTVGDCSIASLLAPVGLLTLLMALVVSMN